jgi:GH25 family lysozyme M1 (1,4-beta-N-acetylmuramidase)
MKKPFALLVFYEVSTFLSNKVLRLRYFAVLLLCYPGIYNAQTCSTGGCAATTTNTTGQYPTTTFSTTSSSWSTVSAFMNAGNFTLFDVTNGDTYEWTYCSDFGGSMGWDAELTLFNNGTGATLCYNDNCSRTNCSTAPYIRWTATFTGTVKLLTTVSGCTTNTGSPYSTLVWRDTSGTPLVQVLGIDVYSGQGTINWTQVKAAGYTFAWAKATEGVGYTDSEYLNYAVNGVAAGIKMGAYHFAHPESNTAVAEANYFLSVAQPYITTCQLPPALDIENPSTGPSLQSSMTSAQLTTWIQDWINTVQAATGITPVIYIGASNAAYVNSSLNIYKLWIDDVTGSSTSSPTNIGVWTTWTFNQYNWTASVPGVPGSTTDLDVFNGNMAAFNNLMGCTTGISKEGSVTDFMIYPNPAANKIMIENASFNYAESDQIYIYNIAGQLLLQQTMQQQKAEINVSEFASGMYFVKMNTSGGISVKKFMKE